MSNATDNPSTAAILALGATVGTWMHLGLTPARRATESAILAVVATLIICVATQIRSPLTIEVHPAPEDRRRADLDSRALSKLRRALPNVDVRYISPDKVIMQDGRPWVAGKDTPDKLLIFPAINPILRPPIKGKVGLWTKTDSTSYFKDYIVTPK